MFSTIDIFLKQISIKVVFSRDAERNQDLTRYEETFIITY